MPNVTYTTALILRCLAAGHGYGFEVMDLTGLPSGTVYPALRRMEKNGWIRSWWEARQPAHREGRPRRKYYTITRRGREVLDGALERFSMLAQLFPQKP